LNSTVVPTASPQARPSRQPLNRSAVVICLFAEFGVSTLHLLW
jgi:hypothetical protein